MNCRHCSKPLHNVFLDLGFAPPSNAYLSDYDLKRPEKYFPLKIMVCDECWLVQTEDYADADALFNSDYAYFSSTSATWLDHALRYTNTMIPLLGLDTESMVVEVASNDGYLLKNFVAQAIPCLGIEPTASTAEAAERLGIPVLREFFGEALGRRLALQGKKADLIIGNNVYAHVPDINDFTLGMKVLLKPEGTITLEFPHLMELLKYGQFDTVYHEHFSYLSLFTVSRIFKRAGLRIYHVEQISTHGGSLRIYGCHAENAKASTGAVANILDQEAKFSMLSLPVYLNFQEQANKLKNDLLSFLLDCKLQGKKIAAYGAAAKGNTVLNYAGIKPDLLPFVCDAAPAKQGKYMPGSHIPILPPAALRKSKLDYVIILPWNIADEVKSQLSDLIQSGVQIVTAVPELKIT